MPMSPTSAIVRIHVAQEWRSLLIRVCSASTRLVNSSCRERGICQRFLCTEKKRNEKLWYYCRIPAHLGCSGTNTRKKVVISRLDDFFFNANETESPISNTDWWLTAGFSLAWSLDIYECMERSWSYGSSRWAGRRRGRIRRRSLQITNPNCQKDFRSMKEIRNYQIKLQCVVLPSADKAIIIVPY